MRYFVTLDGEEHAVDVSELPGGGYDVHLIDPGTGTRSAAVDVDVVARGGLLNLRVAGRVLDLVVDGEPPSLDVFASGHRALLQVESARMRAAASVRGAKPGAGAGAVLSPMPGKVVKVLVAQGDEVEIGAPLVVVEAMKMENELVAEKSGVIAKVHVQPGDAVEGGAQLITIA